MNHLFKKQTVQIANFICLLILVISLFWLGEKPEWFHLLATDPPADKFLHFFVFGGMAALLRLTTLHFHPLLSFMLAAMIGAADEVHQSYIPGRTASFADFSADLVGIILFMTLLAYLQRKLIPPVNLITR